MPSREFWKRKLLALLHDPPSKCLSLDKHEDWAQKAIAAAGLAGETYPRVPDWEASAADRLPFPKSRPAAVSCTFDGVRAAFHHPLGGAGRASAELKFDRELEGVDALEGDATVQPVLDEERIRNWTEADKMRARFFAHWRLWRQWAGERDWRYGFLPADTRIPDHTIWHHMQVTSAFAGCAAEASPTAPLEPAFLKVQIGPVQDFIAAARSTRDLWSGSYLLSWLMAAGLRRLSEIVGPDAVIFPSLWGQPLFDLQWRDALWSQVALSNQERAKTCWEAIKPTDAAVLTPNLPNVFLALVPQNIAEGLAEEVVRTIREEFKTIADSVWNACEAAGLADLAGGMSLEERKRRFDSQRDRFLSLSWNVTPWPKTLEEALATADGFAEDMPVAKARERVRVIQRMAEALLPQEHRDSRYYFNSGPPDYTIQDPAKLKSRGLAWSVLLARNTWELDAVRNLRDFRGAVTAEPHGGSQQKDFLTGKDAIVADGRELRGLDGNNPGAGIPWATLFKHDDGMGAVTLVKRLWHLTHLRDRWGLPTRSDQFPMPNVRGIAAGEPFSNDEQDTSADDEKYFAVLAFDGDQIGKWVGGELTPPTKSQLADYTDGTNTQRKGIREYFERQRTTEFLEIQRAVSPSYHLQFSEALANFSLRCAAAIVEAHNGRLIYSGGDDVLALLPADAALDCARDLVRAFRGEAPGKSVEPRLKGDPRATGVLAQKAPGFLTSSLHRTRTGRAILEEEDPIPFPVPGPAVTASVGLAIAHYKTPLQDVVHAARTAEKRAKSALGRDAFAVSIFKRSGEITEWGCQRSSGGLELFQAIAARLRAEDLTGKFPHRVCQLLTPYLTSRTDLTQNGDAQDLNAHELIQREVGFAIGRQSAEGKRTANEQAILPLLETYLQELDKQYTEAKKRAKESLRITKSQWFLDAVIGLRTSVAFADRTAPETPLHP